MRDYIGAVNAGATNEQLNTAAGTTGRDYVGAVNAGATNEQFGGFDTVKPTPQAEDPRLNYNPFSESGRMIDSPIDTTKAAYNQLANEEWTLGGAIDSARDFAGGALTSLGQTTGLIGDVSSVSPIVSGMRLYNTLTGGAETKGVLEDTLKPASEAMQKGGFSIADNPDSAAFAVGNLLGVGEAGVAKVTGGIAKQIGKFGGNTIGTRGVTREASELIKRIVRDNPTTANANDLIKIAREVPAEHQARIISEQSGATGSGLYRQAATENDESVVAGFNAINERSKALDKVSGTGDFKKIESSTKGEFNAIRDLVDKIDVPEGTVFNTSASKAKLEKLKGIADTDAGAKRIDSLLERMKNDDISLDDMLDVRQRINYEMNKAKGSDTKLWKSVKDDVDSFVGQHVSPEVEELLKVSNKSYSRMKDQEELISLIEKNKSGVSRGSKYEKQGVNWNKLVADIDSAGINSPEVKPVVKLADDFKKKFGDADFKNIDGTTKGGSPETATLAGSVEGILTARLARGFLKKVTDLFSMDRKIVESINESLLKSSDPLDFYKKVAQSKNTPDRIRKEFASLYKEAKAEVAKTPKRERVTGINKAVEANLQKSQTSRNSADNTVTKVRVRVNAVEDRISDVDDRIADAIDKGKPTSSLRIRKAKLEQRLDIDNKDLEIALDKHSALSNKFDKELSDSGYSISETNEFINPAKASARSKVSK